MFGFAAALFFYRRLSFNGIFLPAVCPVGRTAGTFSCAFSFVGILVLTLRLAWFKQAQHKRRKPVFHLLL
jgi:hypothetical protein